MNEERKLAKVKIALMRNPKFAFWSGISMVGKTKVVDGLPTAATNGRDEMYGREFVAKLERKGTGIRDIARSHAQVLSTLDNVAQVVGRTSGRQPTQRWTMKSTLNCMTWRKQRACLFLLIDGNLGLLDEEVSRYEH